MPQKLKAGIDYIAITTPFYCTDGKGLFVLHKRGNRCRDEQGCWDFGGGKLEFGEDLAEGVLREVKEEYGVEGKILEQLPAISILRENHGTQTHWLAIPFFIKVDLKKVVINDADKIDQVGYFMLDELPDPLHSGARYTIKKYQKYFDKYKKK